MRWLRCNESWTGCTRPRRRWTLPPSRRRPWRRRSRRRDRLAAPPGRRSARARESSYSASKIALIQPPLRARAREFERSYASICVTSAAPRARARVPNERAPASAPIRRSARAREFFVSRRDAWQTAAPRARARGRPPPRRLRAPWRRGCPSHCGSNMLISAADRDGRFRGYPRKYPHYRRAAGHHRRGGGIIGQPRARSRQHPDAIGVVGVLFTVAVGRLRLLVGLLVGRLRLRLVGARSECLSRGRVRVMRARVRAGACA